MYIYIYVYTRVWRLKDREERERVVNVSSNRIETKTWNDNPSSSCGYIAYHRSTATCQRHYLIQSVNSTAEIHIYIKYIHIYIYTHIYGILDSLSAARQSFLFLSEPRRGESNHFATSLGSMNFSFNERRTRIGRLVFLMRFRRIVRNVYVCLNRAI